MRVLIVENEAELGAVWQRHLERQRAEVTLVRSQAGAIHALQNHAYHIIVLNLVLPGGSALAIADFASYRCPQARVIFVTDTTFFSDGSIFRYVPNARAFVQSQTPPEDLAAMAVHFAEHP